MARIVKRTEHGPVQVDTNGNPIFVCRCGLSKNPQGLCDGSHKKTLDEAEGKTFVYGENGERVEI
jgi:CDGSH-type Zn-finger protein